MLHLALISINPQHIVLKLLRLELKFRERDSCPNIGIVFQIYFQNRRNIFWKQSNKDLWSLLSSAIIFISNFGFYSSTLFYVFWDLQCNWISIESPKKDLRSDILLGFYCISYLIYSCFLHGKNTVILLLNNRFILSNKFWIYFIVCKSRVWILKTNLIFFYQTEYLIVIKFAAPEIKTHTLMIFCWTCL